MPRGRLLSPPPEGDRARMSGPTHPAHEGFQGLIAEGAQLKGAIVLSTATKAPADLVILPHRVSVLPPLIVEVKTSKRDARIALDGDQLDLQIRLNLQQHGATHVLLCLRRTPHRPKGQPSGEISYEIGGHREWDTEEPEHQVFLYLADCYERGRAALLARKGLLRVDAP